MRIHRLEMQAFGPFADRQTVDFDALGEQGLFLLNGPTGAGKTSVLDAICFALYGSVPGARQEARKLRSDHAAPGVVPEVVLDFSAGERRFQVVRSPQWERPAKRAGSARGTVTEQARTLLSERVHGEWVQKTTRNDEAAAEIQALLGMSREQFTRVVMLPQGDFAAFLRADATSRAELLQRLFGTWRYEEIEQQLKAEADEAKAQLASAQASADLLRARARSEVERCAKLVLSPDGSGPDFLQGLLPGTEPAGTEPTGTEPAGETGDARAAADSPGPTDSAWLSAVRSGLTAHLTFLRDAQKSTSERFRQAEESLHRIEARRARGLALLQLEADEREHAARFEASLPQRRALEAHVRAEGLRGYLDSLASAEAGVERTLKAAQASLEELVEAAGAAGLKDLVPAYRPDSDGPDSTLPEAEALALLEDHTAKEISAAENALADAERAAALGQLAAREQAREEQLRAEAAAAGDTAGNYRAEKEELGAALPSLRARAGAMEAARRRMEEATRIQEVIRGYTAARAAAAASAEAAAGAREVYQDARGKWQDLLQLRLDQAAAELASTLTPGSDCPVCGSASHPSPAPLPEGRELVTREEEAAARTATADAEKIWEGARAAAEADASRAAALHAQGGDSDPEEARSAGEQAAGELRAAEQAAEELGDTEERLQEIEAELSRLEASRSSLLQEAAQAQARAAAAAEEKAELLRRGSGETSGPEALSALLEALGLVRRLTAAARTALQAARQAGEFRLDAAKALEGALGGTGFEDTDAARAALLPGPEAQELRSGIEALDAEAARLALRRENEDALASLDSDGVPEAMPNEEDVAEASEAAEAARREVSAAAVQVELLAGSAEALADLAEQLAQAEAETEPLRQRHELLQSVSDTARGNGENNYRMALSTYVLAARLEQVAAAATERLAAMTGGRYSLVHDDSKSGNRRAGLGLHVIDDWTGIRRDTSTLSGGESFMASLALALGLADVVQQESGGTSMETLFVDEGFGSLDEEALEQVMDALEGLRDGGRMVGLVSHVAEMKQRISAQLQITRGRNGSTVHYRMAGAPAA
ncbi:SMC family ATPase [Arthrobacter koreensis]|uniref:SMC family ATPase n=1 Tax=Arthrobacter koreensis TaxID=199136 RepID=UPI002DB65FAC|nr:SMC family ATPase [Arthrobacter koreensis]MEB7504584.1 SMC family ATPase [Arthrobacter koreensis]